MVSFSLCMIVKNEEKTLPVCLSGLKNLMDEMIIVDTGSTDGTKAVAERFGAKVYDFAWQDDFAAARNFAFSKASCDYIYSADADEILDRENQDLLLVLKKCLDPSVDIVQMYYCHQLSQDTVYNFDRELRPKLFKRLRTFLWEGPVHEQVRLNPIVFDSDIEIIHEPHGEHIHRDLSAFHKAVLKGAPLSGRLFGMYARELVHGGSKEEFEDALPFFIEQVENPYMTQEELRETFCVIARGARLTGDEGLFMKAALKSFAMESCAEICCELGNYYQEKGDHSEAVLWYYNAAFQTKSILDIHAGGDYPLRQLSKCYEALGDLEEAKRYALEADHWQPPQAED